MNLSIVFTDGEAKMVVRISDKGVSVRRPSKRSEKLEAIAEELLKDGVTHSGIKAFLEQGPKAVLVGEERCG